MRLLCLDIGNTAAHAAVVEDGRVAVQFRREHGGGQHPAALDELHAWCGKVIAGHTLAPDATAPRSLEEDPEIDGIMVASVVPALSRRWRTLWQQDTRTRSIPLREVDHHLHFPFTVEVDRPDTVGADRWCNLAGAFARGHRDALVVDLGTANTYDLLVEGRFRGGWIAPGLVSSHRAMLQRGALLPEIEFEAPRTFPGRDTAEAIRGGSWLQGWGGVSAVIRAFLHEHPGLQVLVTGGLSPLFFDERSGPADQGIGALRVDALTLEGAAYLYEREGTA